LIEESHFLVSVTFSLIFLETKNVDEKFHKTKNADNFFYKNKKMRFFL